MKMGILSGMKSILGKNKTGDIDFAPTIVAYLRSNGEIYICAQSKFRGLVRVESEPFISHSIDDDPIIIGESMVAAKSESSGFFERDNDRDFIPPYFEMAGVKTYSQFAKYTKSMNVDFNPQYIEYSPLRNERGTWYGIPDKKTQIPVDSELKLLGEQLLVSFKDAVA